MLFVQNVKTLHQTLIFVISVLSLVLVPNDAFLFAPTSISPLNVDFLFAVNVPFSVVAFPSATVNVPPNVVVLFADTTTLFSKVETPLTFRVLSNKTALSTSNSDKMLSGVEITTAASPPAA